MTFHEWLDENVTSGVGLPHVSEPRPWTGKSITPDGIAHAAMVAENEHALHLCEVPSQCSHYRPVDEMP